MPLDQRHSQMFALGDHWPDVSLPIAQHPDFREASADYPDQLTNFQARENCAKATVARPTELQGLGRRTAKLELVGVFELGLVPAR